MSTIRHVINGTVRVERRGRAGIAVSNGEAVVRTGPGGHFRLRIDPARHRFVFVVVPDDAVCSGPFYIPTDCITKSASDIHFELQTDKSRRRRNFEFAHLTDFHLRHKRAATSAVTTSRSSPIAKIIGKAVRQTLSEPTPAFAVATGDLTQFGDIPSLKACDQLMRAAPCPVLPMFAPHDGFEIPLSGKPAKDGWTRNYESVLGPTYYSFDWGGRHFVLLANQDKCFVPSEAEAKSRWLANDLKTHAGKPTVLFLHVPPTRPFLDRLTRTDVFAVVYGHYHSSKVYSYRGIQVFNTPCLAYGGIDGSPRGARRFFFRRGRMTTRLVYYRNRPAQGVLSSPKPRPAVPNRSPLRLLWSRRLDAEIHRAAPVVAGTKVLLCPRDEQGQGRPGVLCLNLDDGRVCWHLVTDASVKNSVAVAAGSQVPNRLADGLAAAISVTGRLFVFQTRTGRITWTTDLPGYPERWIYTSPAVNEGVVYAGGQAGLGAYKLSNGKQIWYYKPTDQKFEDDCCYAGPVLAEDNIIFFVQGRGLVALDRASAREQWWHQIKGQDVWMYPQPLAVRGRLVASGEYGELINLDLTNGQIVWQRAVSKDRHWDQTMTGLGADETDVFLTVPSGQCQARSLASGRLKWRIELGQDLLDMTPYLRDARSGSGGPIAFGDFVALGAGDGHLYLLDRRSGALLDRWWFGSPISAAACVANGRLVVSSFDGLLACFDIHFRNNP